MPTTTAKGRTKPVELKFPAFSGDDKRLAILVCADDFNPRKAFNIVLFFHGFDLPLDKQVTRHALAEQVVKCRQNCVIVCPRTAISRTAEHNPGAFGDEGYFSKFLGELPTHIKDLVGDSSLDIADLTAMAARARLVVATFSAGHRVASAVLSYSSVRERLAALAFFDSLYESDFYYQHPDFILNAGALVGVYRTIYDQGADERDNHKELIARLTSLHAAPSPSIDAVEALHPGVAIMESVDIGDHWQIVSNSNRLAQILTKIKVEALDEAVSAD